MHTGMHTLGGEWIFLAHARRPALLHVHITSAINIFNMHAEVAAGGELVAK